MIRKPKERIWPGSFDAFMDSQSQRGDEPAVQESQPQPKKPQTDEDILAAALMTAHGDAPARAAIAKIRSAHPEDFDCWLKTMAVMTPVFRPDFSRISLPEYVEAMYAVIKHAGFMAEHRVGILQAVRPVSSARPN